MGRIGPLEIILFLVILSLYFIPSIIGRYKTNSLGIFLLNLFVGWTIIGWIGALIWAITSPLKQPDINYYRNQAISKFNNGDYQESIKLLYEILKIAPNDNQTLFDLSCLYSVIQKKDEAFFSLSNAVMHGYNNIENINKVQQLNWLRNQPEWEGFKNNSFKINITRPNNSATTLTIAEQIEKLFALKNQGALTEEEFNKEKDKIMTNTTT